MKLVIHGAGGRMGREVALAALEDSSVQLVGAIDHDGSNALGKDLAELVGREVCGVRVGADLKAVLDKADVVIDFSLPPALPRLIDACSRAGVALVSGTTGTDETIASQLAELQKHAAVLTAANFSLGVNVLIHLANLAARALGQGFDAELVEMHHRRKIDAPSGTAIAIADAVRDAKSLSPSQAVYGREGKTGARPSDQIGIMTLRGGDVVGDHTLILAGDGERLELTHRASNRGLFAKGALRAAHWITGKEPGRYTMNNVLGL